jgi:flavodoxin
MQKTLIVYYSLEGNTKLIAETIAKEMNADIMECKPKKDISKKWFMKYVRGGRQAVMKSEPELEKLSKDASKYDTIIIGTPVRAFTYTPAIRTFFKTIKLQSKKIALFCTHEWGPGSTLENMEQYLIHNNIISKIEFINVKKNQTANIAKAKQRAFTLLSYMMPTKKTPVKKTTKVTANFSANIPEEIIECCQSNGCGSKKKRHKKSTPGSFYFLGFVGAAIYFIGTASTFRIGVLGVLKAIVRPAFLIHGLLKFLWL